MAQHRPHAYECTNTHTHRSAHARTHTRMHASTHASTHPHTHARTHARTGREITVDVVYGELVVKAIGVRRNELHEQFLPLVPQQSLKLAAIVLLPK